MGLFRRGAELAHAGKDESVDDDPAHADIKEGLQVSGACDYPAFGTEEQVSEWTKQQVDKKPDIKVLIRCDQDAKHLYLANVISICRSVGVPKANIAVKTEK